MTAVALQQLTKTFASPVGPVQAVRGIDLEIARGSTVALLGPNGAGKSTTIEMIIGLAKQDAGSVTVFDQSPSAAVDRGAIGAMLQTGAVLGDLSVRELLDMMGSLFPAPLGVDEALELAAIADIADRRTTKLSGGQTQRVRFAVALVSNPDLLILDEPTVAMDVTARQSFWATIRSLNTQGKTVIFATHYLEEADANADRIVLMARGAIVADGTPSEIRATTGSRVIRVTIDEASAEQLEALDGVHSVTGHAGAWQLQCSDSDAAVRALLAAFPVARNLEITSAGLEQAFMDLTA